MPTNTLNCKASAHAARQSCTLNGLYDTCGVGFEFAQVPVGDAGVITGDAGVPMVTVPFDISRYKAITFWGMTTTPDPTTNSMQVKVSFPDTDTDPRGQVCNGGGGNTSKCYNSYAAYLNFTTSWQQFTVFLDASDRGLTASGGIGIAIDTTWGYLQAQWIPTQVYGINWQARGTSTRTRALPLRPKSGSTTCTSSSEPQFGSGCRLHQPLRSALGQLQAVRPRHATSRYRKLTQVSTNELHISPKRALRSIARVPEASLVGVAIGKRDLHATHSRVNRARTVIDKGNATVRSERPCRTCQSDSSPLG